MDKMIRENMKAIISVVILTCMVPSIILGSIGASAMQQKEKIAICNKSINISLPLWLVIENIGSFVAASLLIAAIVASVNHKQGYLKIIGILLLLLGLFQVAWLVVGAMDVIKADEECRSEMPVIYWIVVASIIVAVLSVVYSFVHPKLMSSTKTK